MVFFKVTSNLFEMTNNPSGRVLTKHLIYKSMIEVLKGSNEIDAFI